MNHALAHDPRHAATADDPLRILLAEDDRELRRLLALVFRRDGHEVVAVSNGGELLAELAATLIEPKAPKFDLVVCEHQLPAIQGLTVLGGLRARRHETPFVLISGEPAVQERARRLGAVVLDHPFNVDAIRGAILSCAQPA